MIIDAFPFAGEEVILDIRFNVLMGIVDKFVIIESTHTFTGVERDLVWPKIRNKYPHLADRVDYIPVNGSPVIGSGGGEADDRQWHLRDILRLHVSDTCEARDICIFSDVDEIPNPDALIAYNPNDGIMALHMQFFYFYLNTQVAGPGWWDAKIVPHGIMQLLSARDIRFFDGIRHKRILYNGGWHFSSCGGVKALLTKGLSTHESTPEWKNEDYLRRVLADPLRPTNGAMRLMHREVDIHFPLFVQRHEAGLRELGYIYHPPLDHPYNNYHELPDECNQHHNG